MHSYSHSCNTLLKAYEYADGRGFEHPVEPMPKVCMCVCAEPRGDDLSTAQFAAPEMLARQRCSGNQPATHLDDKRCDMWALGCSMHCLVTCCSCMWDPMTFPPTDAAFQRIRTAATHQQKQQMTLEAFIEQHELWVSVFSWHLPSCLHGSMTVQQTHNLRPGLS